MKNAPSFPSWASPVLFSGTDCLQWKGQEWQYIWETTMTLLETSCPQCSPQSLSWRQLLNGIVVARTINLAYVPAVHLYWNSWQGARMSFVWLLFARQGQKGGHTFIFLPSSPLVLFQRPGASQGYRGRSLSGRTEDQIYTQRLLSMCWSWRRLGQGGLSCLDLDEGLHS